MATSSSAMIDGGTKKLITFNARGMKPDVDLEVLGTHMYVHSAILKLHSTFFFKFLDSPDKLLPVSVSASGIIYEWVTSVDADGSWALVDHCSQKKASVGNREYNGEKSTQINAFNKLLCAIYGERFEFQSIQELVLVAHLADYYCSLAVLSKAVDGALLRSSLNFKESALVGIQGSLVKYYKEVFRILSSPSGLVGATASGDQPLMANNLKLERGDVKSGEGDYQDYFLCAVVTDEDLPWDVSQLDW
ncbi:hypothetical protein DL98DRAFT_658200 [Cadophora sp. DSE1049]|nr:hypothetical protein DL98DRAFT_658200 [Cadophora sp. DSE1049]